MGKVEKSIACSLQSSTLRSRHSVAPLELDESRHDMVLDFLDMRCHRRFRSGLVPRAQGGENSLVMVGREGQDFLEMYPIHLEDGDLPAQRRHDRGEATIARFKDQHIVETAINREEAIVRPFVTTLHLRAYLIQ